MELADFNILPTHGNVGVMAVVITSQPLSTFIETSLYTP
jgi:hypothetical protein